MSRERISAIFEKLTPAKTIGFVLAGILLVVLTIPAKEKDGLVFKESSEPSIRTELEQSLILFLSKLEDVGNTDVVIYQKNREEHFFSEEQDGEIIGVLISCDGADSPYVQSKIIESVSALFDLPINKIRVLKREFLKE